MDRYDVVVLGAGAAGLMCAAVAGARGLRVVVLEHAAEPGKKILISGGGRCNFTNTGTGPNNFLSKNPHFAKSALSRYTPHDFIALVDRYGIAWHEKTLGQLFCDGSARQIVRMLLDECAKADVSVCCGENVVDFEHADGEISVSTNRQRLRARAVVVATGGASIPKMGASGFAYGLARKFGLNVIEPRPALVPLTLDGNDKAFCELRGVSADVEARANGAAFREAMLFTHRGISGPAILQASSYWSPGAAIDIDFLPERKRGWLVDAKARNPRATILGQLNEALPARLAHTLFDEFELSMGPTRDIGNISDRVLGAIEQRLSAWRFVPNGSEGFAKAEVSAGGVDTNELSSRTMEAKRVPGLYFIGECVDVTGWLGGYNFQWAWASGSAAGQSL